jgi:1-acyl-sn-glycerol-3-phosphate acyltransferase
MPLYEPKAPSTNKLTRAISGVSFLLISTAVVVAMYPFIIFPLTLISRIFENKQRRLCDYYVQWWARATMTIFNASVKVEGIENLPPASEPVMYTPNHCSFLDIFSLTGYLPRRFKYISKIEILRIPLIGWGMGFAKHIAIRRTDRASQLKTLKDAIETLKDGNSLVTFPEGTRSKDGRIGAFKKGPFTMASRAGVRVVPVSIVGTQLFFPSKSLLPIARPRGIRIVIHPPLDPPADKTKEGEVLEAARAAVISGLPPSMQPAAA